MSLAFSWFLAGTDLAKSVFFYTHCIDENLIYLCKRRFNTMQYHLIYRLDVKHASNLSKMLFCPICKNTE